MILQDKATTLLLVTHVAIRSGERGPQIDDQTAAGIAQWCRHFNKVTYYGIAEDPSNPNASTHAWVNLANIAACNRCELIALPRAYRAGSMLRAYRDVRAKLRMAVATHRHLCFTFGGLFGDWPAVAAREAIRQQRRYGAWIDRVEPLVFRNKMMGAPMSRRLQLAAALPIIGYNTRYLLRNSSVALLQGMDTFEYFAKDAKDPHCTYDTHTQSSDQIAPEELARKQARILRGEPIHLVYVGRAAAMKGPADWLESLQRLHMKKVPFRATWVGDGPELPMMRQRVAGSALSDAVHLPGFEGDRDALLRTMRRSDLLLFCHKTPESPRSLIEALVSGCPLVGYDSAYPRGLVQTKGGGVFAPQDDVEAVAERIVQLHRDRWAFAALVADAAASGKSYNEDVVYEVRADLMKRG